jgi:hypothetical protein
VKTKVVAASAIAALLIVGVATVAFANSGILTPHNSQGENDDHQGPQTAESDHGDGGGLNLTVGQILKFGNLTGHFNNLTSESSEDEHDDSRAGNSTGNFTFKVTSASAGGVTLTFTSGSFTINKTTYTVTAGTILLNEGNRSGTGNGTASGGATFMIRVSGIHGNLTTMIFDGHFKLDVKVGTSEYHVLLGTPEAEDETSED